MSRLSAWLSFPPDAYCLVFAARLKLGLEINVDVIRAAVDVAEQARGAEDAGPVRDAEAEEGFVPLLRADEVADAEIDRGVEGLEELRLVAAALGEVAVLAERNPLRPGQAEPEADAGAQA